MTGCSASDIARTAVGAAVGGSGGPSVEAQVGRSNTKAIVAQGGPEAVLRPNSRVDTLDQSQTTNNELPIWVWVALIIALIAGWVTDTPSTILKNMRNK